MHWGRWWVSFKVRSLRALSVHSIVRSRKSAQISCFGKVAKHASSVTVPPPTLSLSAFARSRARHALPRRLAPCAALPSAARLEKRHGILPAARAASPRASSARHACDGKKLRYTHRAHSAHSPPASLPPHDLPRCMSRGTERIILILVTLNDSKEDQGARARSTRRTCRATTKGWLGVPSRSDHVTDSQARWNRKRHRWR